MIPGAWRPRAGFRQQRGVFRNSTWDGWLVALSLLHAGLLFLAPAAPVLAILLWWNTNTITHSFVHLSFFNSPAANRLYGLYLTLLLGFPETLFRDRHLAHHAERAVPFRVTLLLLAESAAVATLWALLAWRHPSFFWTAYVPGYAAGMALCSLHKYYEHAGGTVSHYGRLYNVMFLNDGYHVEHHRHPSEHWKSLPRLSAPETLRSSWPAVLRWLELVNLNRLERLVVRSATLRMLLLRTHERALRKLLPKLGSPATVLIVGGGIFPRTALLLRQLLLDAELTVVDSSEESLAIAAPWLPAGVRVINKTFDAGRQAAADLVTIPLSFHGDRRSIYQCPPAPSVLIHDWIWVRRGEGVVVSWLLLKRLNLLRRGGPASDA